MSMNLLVIVHMHATFYLYYFVYYLFFSRFSYFYFMYFIDQDSVFESFSFKNRPSWIVNSIPPL